MAFLLTFDIQSCDLDAKLLQTASNVRCWLIIAASISASSRFD